MLNANRPNRAAFSSYVAVVNFMAKAYEDLVADARAQAATGFGIDDETIETFAYAQRRMQRYAFRPAA